MDRYIKGAVEGISHRNPRWSNKGTGWFEGQRTYAPSPRRFVPESPNDGNAEGPRRWRGESNQNKVAPQQPGSVDFSRVQVAGQHADQHLATTRQWSGIPSDRQNSVETCRTNARRGLSPEQDNKKSFSLEGDCSEVEPMELEPSVPTPQLETPEPHAKPDNDFNPTR